MDSLGTMGWIGIGIVIISLLAAVVLVARSLTERRRLAERRLLSPPDSGVGLTRLAPEPEPDLRSRFDTWFETAVRHSGLDASPLGVLAVMVFLATLLGGSIWLWKENLGLTIVGILLGLGIPLGVVAWASRRYRRQLQEQLPDAFRMIAGSVRAGLPIEDAIRFYAEQGAPPLANELRHTVGLMQLGLSPTAALQSTARRIRLMDFDLLVSTVGLYTQTGGNLVLLLERLADSVRDRNQYRGQFLAATAQGRIVAIAIGLAGPLLLLAYLLAEPEYVQGFLNSPSGWSIILMCGLMQLIGIVWLLQILKIEY
ncbi:MAG: type II secretion system F family protein [Gemmataceae bacterium]|nr:type II secretion system F family protein [Gemmataceae bacterium]MDW8243469.1 type II secretion system F family protein [Thermogemmata sp.]